MSARGRMLSIVNASLDVHFHPVSFTQHSRVGTNPAPRGSTCQMMADRQLTLIDYEGVKASRAQATMSILMVRQAFANDRLSL